VLLAAFLLTTGCSGGTTKLTSDDNGKKIHIKAGERFAIELEGNPSTGYTWEVTDLDANYLQQVGETGFKGSFPGLAGSGGIQTLTFITKSAGQTNLTLVHHRPWEKDVAPLESYQVVIIVD
jgi:inhibitor of cysteine peptidase